VAVRSSKHTDRRLFYHRVPEDWRKEAKLQWLAQRETLNGIEWRPLIPDARNAWFVPESAAAYSEMVLIGSKAGKAGLDDQTVFQLFSLGVKTNRDEAVYDFNRNALLDRSRDLIDEYNSEVDRYLRSGGTPAIDAFVRYDKIKWSETLKSNLERGRYGKFDERAIRPSLYRPFTKRFLYFDELLVERRYKCGRIYPVSIPDYVNPAICISGPGHDEFRCLIANCIVEIKFSNSANGGTQCFPFYVYDEDGSNRRENITDWALRRFQEHYENDSISNFDIFYYVYLLLHLPSYRERFADSLKKEFPRVPLAAQFRAFSKAGNRLAELHLGYETLEPWSLDWVYAQGRPLSYRVEKMKLSRDRTAIKVNDSLTLAKIPSEVFDYRLGGCP